jgi:hypothetical protein
LRRPICIDVHDVYRVFHGRRQQRERLQHFLAKAAAGARVQ